MTTDPREVRRRGLRVAIDARTPTGVSGGIQSLIVGLADGLSRLDGQEDDYVFLTFEGHDEWLRSHIDGACRVVAIPARGRGGARYAGRSRTRRRAAGLWRRLAPERVEVSRPARSDGWVESLQADVVHFTMQMSGFLSDVPSIYHPHDLQHVHLPEFFTPAQIAARERWYDAMCAQAALVVVASEWTRQDVIGHYGLPSDKVVVVPLAPPFRESRVPTAGRQAEVRSRFHLPASYILYPAQTWRHKNHVRLLRALALLRDRDGRHFDLVATGHQNDYFDTIRREQHALQLDDRVTWLGYVPEDDLRAIYASARAVIIPSLFEAASFPLWEAFMAGVPSACSAVTSLPDQAGDAALLFDPSDIEAIADAILSLDTDQALRATLIANGRSMVAARSWDRTSALFRAHYRRLAGQASEADRELLSTRSSV